MILCPKWTAANENDDRQLEELYELYVKFSQDLRANGIPDYPIRRFSDFKTWLLSLADHVRAQCIEQYRTGYHQLIDAARPIELAPKE